MTRLTKTTALLLVLALLGLTAAPVLAEEATPGADALGEPVRRLLAEMEGVLEGALEHARAGEADAALADVRTYLGLLRQLDQLLPPRPEGQPETPPPGNPEQPRPPLAGLRPSLERQGRLLAAIAHVLPREARTQLLELLRAEMEAGYQHPVILALVRRAMAEASRGLRRQELEKALEQARIRLAQAEERAAQLEERARQMEARLDEITDPARRELAAKRVQLAWLDHAIALKMIERLNLLIEILEGELALLQE